jgi:glycerate kinase
MAQAAGLALVPHSKRDPMRATTYGVGQLIADALKHGCRMIAVTLGGSATVDGGCGMAQALGARLLDDRGRPIPPGGAGLGRLATIDARPLRRLLRGVRVTGLTDVRNPLLGPRGASHVFAPQKGATPSQVKKLERGLVNATRICRRDLGVDSSRIPGAGAAGGLGAGLIAFLDAKLVSGADWIFHRLRLDSRLKRADLVLTGEGSLDSQTRMGKLIARVAVRARRARVPVIAFAGRVALSRRDIKSLGLMAAHGLSGKGVSEKESLERAGDLLERRTLDVLRDYRPSAPRASRAFMSAGFKSSAIS